MINLDPSIIDQEGVRKKRRKKLFLYAILPIIILFAAGAFFMRPGVFDIIFGMMFDSPDAGGAVMLSGMQKQLNILEPYIAFYNSGTALIKDRNGVEAEKDLRESMRQNPPKDVICKVRVNLSYSIEMQADEAAIKQKYDEALVLYSKAEGVLYEDGCASRKDSSQGKDDKAKQSQDRISKKRNDVVSRMNGEANEDGGQDVDMRLEVSDEEITRMRDQLVPGQEIQNKVQQRLGIGSYSSSNIEHW